MSFLSCPSGRSGTHGPSGARAPFGPLPAVTASIPDLPRGPRRRCWFQSLGRRTVPSPLVLTLRWPKQSPMISLVPRGLGGQPCSGPPRAPLKFRGCTSAEEGRSNIEGRRGGHRRARRDGHVGTRREDDHLQAQEEPALLTPGLRDRRRAISIVSATCHFAVAAPANPCVAAGKGNLSGVPPSESRAGRCSERLTPPEAWAAHDPAWSKRHRN